MGVRGACGPVHERRVNGTGHGTPGDGPAAVTSRGEVQVARLALGALVAHNPTSPGGGRRRATQAGAITLEFDAEAAILAAGPLRGVERDEGRAGCPLLGVCA